MLPIQISEAAYHTMKAHAEAAYPNECCGFFYGQEGEVRQIVEAREVVNSKEGDQRRRFEVSPLDYLRAEQYADAAGLTLLGVYHSHPEHPAIPSEHDLRQAVPFFSYIILSVKSAQTVDLRSWQLNAEGAFEEENIKQQVHHS